MSRKESQEDQFRRKLADWLGITFDELEEYAEDIEENPGPSNRDYAYILPFSEATPQEILDKLIRISRKKIVYFNLEELG